LKDFAENILSEEVKVVTNNEFAKQQEMKNTGVGCYLTEKGLKKEREKEDYFFEYEGMKEFTNLFSHEPVKEKKEIKDFDFDKKPSLSCKDFFEGENQVWKSKWDNVCFLGAIKQSVANFIQCHLKIPVISEKHLSKRSLLISTPVRINKLCKNKKVSNFLIESFENSELTLKRDHLSIKIKIYSHDDIELYSKNLSKDSKVYVHDKIRTKSTKKKNFRRKIEKSNPWHYNCPNNSQTSGQNR